MTGVVQGNTDSEAETTADVRLLEKHKAVFMEELEKVIGVKPKIGLWIQMKIQNTSRPDPTKGKDRTRDGYTYEVRNCRIL